MTNDVTIYVSQPATKRAPWRVRTFDCPEREFPTEIEAVAAATQYAQMIEANGGRVTVKVECSDGSWNVHRA